ncbi:metallophosphoesterase family protein [Novosphingobium album (ex Liu et al. 2023)]|uniref:Metallophosphoesterase family protein n=1 Tax=Novosphingobium album (ex Liu et al. 2023) TaxID=3031130 RepID=A0ABT5WS20_9SPHN|nr:metallophosphoesterase family protein [Novosphingobium album (ex Liu et al. 2023)]MDE8652649.1 metallophosphoesterase family protein [Novosphingobium album (ex Liu et al. 2023)]
MNLRNFFRREQPTPIAAIPPGERVYAIGDIHGRLDLLVEIGRAIDRDDARRGPADTTVIFLGDLIDRGPESATVVAAAREWARERKVRYIAGNHEEMFLSSFDKLAAFRNFLRNGGTETVLSYGVDPEAFMAADLEQAQKMMFAAVPRADLAFLRSFEQMILVGDYLFVHAGIRPDEPLDKQAPHDCRWIREPFLSHPGQHGVMVVHGHTVTGEPEVLANRIGIDTGAFMSGCLTALGLEGRDRWLIQTSEDSGAIETVARAA